MFVWVGECDGGDEIVGMCVDCVDRSVKWAS